MATYEEALQYFRNLVRELVSLVPLEIAELVVTSVVALVGVSFFVYYLTCLAFNKQALIIERLKRSEFRGFGGIYPMMIKPYSHLKNPTVPISVPREPTPPLLERETVLEDAVEGALQWLNLSKEEKERKEATIKTKR